MHLLVAVRSNERKERGVDETGKRKWSEVSYRKRDDTLRIDKPAAPFLLVDADAVDALDRGLVQRVSRGQADDDLHRLVVDLVAGDDFFGLGVDFDDELLRVGVLGRDPVFNGGELGGDDGGGYLLIVCQYDMLGGCCCSYDVWGARTCFSVHVSIASTV